MNICNKHDWDEKTCVCKVCGVMHFGTVLKPKELNK